jgi:hypothetical protein
VLGPHNAGRKLYEWGLVGVLRLIGSVPLKGIMVFLTGTLVNCGEGIVIKA